MSTENRLENLRRLIKKFDGPALLAAKLGYANASFLVQMAGPNPTRDISEKTARKIETSLNLPEGWLDAKSGEESPVTHVDAAKLSDVVRVVVHLTNQAGVVLKPETMAELVTLTYEDATEHRLIRPEYVVRLINLMK